MYEYVFVCTPVQTVSFDFERSSDQGEQGGVEGHCTITVQGHVHCNQPLPKRERHKDRYDKGREHTRWIWCTCLYLAGHTMRAEFPKSKWWLDPPEQSHNIQVLNTTPGKQTHLICLEAVFLFKYKRH